MVVLNKTYYCDTIQQCSHQVLIEDINGRSKQLAYLCSQTFAAGELIQLH